MDRAQDPIWAEAAELAADRADRAEADRGRPLRPIDALIAELGFTREELANGGGE